MVKKGNVLVGTNQKGITVKKSETGKYKFPEDGSPIEMPREHFDILSDPSRGGIDGLFYEAKEDTRKPKKKHEPEPEPEETPEEKAAREEKERDEKREAHDSSFKKLR